MNKTLKTVLITLSATFVFLIAVIMIFGEDPSVPIDTSNSSNTDSKLTKELYAATLAYDIFDWNTADDKKKLEIAKNIINIWNDSGNSSEISAKDLVTYINQNLHDQANIFEVACVAAQIDPLPFLNKTN